MGHFSTIPLHTLPSTRDVWIETGTYLGESVLIAKELGFRTIHSIELFERNYQKAKARTKNLPDTHLHLGDSKSLLPQILSTHSSIRSRSVVFWLDGHYQGRVEGERGEEECPLLSELQALLEWGGKGDVLVCIDDFRLFLPDFWDLPESKKFVRAQWPTSTQIDQIISSFPENFRVYKNFN